MAGMLALGLLLASLQAPRRALLAGSSNPDDLDCDGLVDAQELVEQSSASLCDSDGDGFSDLEEVARASSPILATCVPLPASSALALTARGQSDKLHVSMLVYFTSGRLSDLRFTFGVVAREGRVFMIPSGAILATATVSEHPTLSGTGTVGMLEFDLNPAIVGSNGSLSLFATMSVAGAGQLLAAAVVDFAMTGDGVLMKRTPVPQSIAASRAQTGSPGSVYQPIPPNNELPAEWSPGRICFQKSVPVGYEAGIVLTRVVSADCWDGWDAYCSPMECKASVGDEFSTVDPVGLIGG